MFPTPMLMSGSRKPSAFDRPPHLLLVVVFSLFLITCGSDSTTTPDEDTAPPSRVLTISLDASSGDPASRITINGIPNDVNWAYALVTVSGTAQMVGGRTVAQNDSGVALIDRTASGDELVVPLHPLTPMQGGTVQIEVTNGTNITSNQVTLNINSLTQAPGAFDAMITKLENLVDGWIAQQGTTAEALRAVAGDQMSALELPAYLLHAIVSHPDNPNSLRAFADGDIPMEGGDPVDRDLLDALAASSGLSAFLDEKNAFVDTLTAPDTPVQFLAGGAHRSSAQFDCIEGPTFDIGPGNCRKLAEVMSYQAEIRLEKMGAVEKLQDDAIDAITTALSYARGAQIAWGILNTLWVADNIEEGSTGVYPSSFVSDQTDFTADPDVVPEDFTAPGKWSDFRVTAVSEGWRFDTVLKDAIDRAKGLENSGWDDEALQDFFDKAQEKTYADYVDKVQSHNKNVVYDGLKTELELDDIGKLEYCQQTWPGIDCTGPPFSEGSSPDLMVNSENLTYEPTEVGATTLEVKTSGIFGLIPPTAETKPIETKRIELFIDPFRAAADINESVGFTVRVENAEDETVEWYTEGTVPADFVPSGDQATVVTPSTPWSSPILLKARSLSNTGLRENMTNTDPREDTAPITHGEATVLVGPLGVCLKPGETQPYDATVLSSEDQSVTWSTEPPGTGSFQGDVYEAPNTKVGPVTIIATSVADPEAQGFAQVTVGGCECWWTAIITGDRVFFWTGTMAEWASPGAGLSGFVFRKQVEGAGIHLPGVSASILTTLGEGITGTWDSAIGLIESDEVNSWTSGDPESQELPQLTITFNDGETIEGTINGPFFRPVANSNPVQFEVLQLNLNFKATDGSKALCRD